LEVKKLSKELNDMKKRLLVLEEENCSNKMTPSHDFEPNLEPTPTTLEKRSPRDR